MINYNVEITNEKEYDFVVCGGGMTGFSAAVSAARNGVKTAIIEKAGCLGGNATSAGVCHLLGAKRFDGKTGQLTKLVGGMFDEIADALIKINAAVDPYTIDTDNNPHGWYAGLAEGVPFDPEQMKVLLDEFCVKAGVDIYYFTDIIDAKIDSNHVQYIIAHNKSGLFAVRAKLFADTTGDADIAYLCGCPTVLGRDEDNLTAPASLEMHVENVDREALAEYIKTNNTPRFRELILELREKGIWTFPYEIFIAVQLHRPDIFMINTIRQVGIDGTDGESVSRGMTEGRRENLALFEIMQKYFPGFANARIRSIAPVIGIRETRRIIGRYILTVDDLVTGKEIQDSVACSGYGWDLPDPKLPSYQPALEIKRKSQFTQIPYGCLLPKNINNLIFAGRCISVERDVLGPIRVMGPCIAMGQAAGLASAIALRKNLNYPEIDVKELQSEITKSGGIYKI